MPHIHIHLNDYIYILSVTMYNSMLMERKSNEWNVNVLGDVDPGEDP
jgi:hypothetical protein